MATLSITIPALNVALSWMPFTRMMVTSSVMTIAGRSNQVPVPASIPVAGSKSKGALREDERQPHAEEGEEILEVMGPSMRDGGGRDRVFEDRDPSR